MENKGGGNIREIVNSIACEIAKKRLNFKDDDKDNQSKLALLSLKISEEQEAVKESIDGIYNTIKAQYFGMVLPSGLKQEVAEYVFLQVNEKDLYSVSEIEVGDATVKEILVSALQHSDNKEMSKKNVATNALESFRIFEGQKLDIDVNELIKENEKLGNQIAPQIFNKAHDINATKDDKDIAVVMMLLSELDAFSELGLKFGQLKYFDKKTVIDVISALKRVDLNMAQNYMKVFNLDEEALKSDSGETSYTLDTNTLEMDEEAKKINFIANRVGTFLEYESTLSEEQKSKRFLAIKKIIDQSEYPIDGILSGLIRSGNINPDNPYCLELLNILKSKLKDPNNISIDGYVTLEFIRVEKTLLEKDENLTSELLDAFNNCVSDEEPKISIEMIERIKKEKLNTIDNNIDDNSIDNFKKSGTLFIVKTLMEEKSNDKLSNLESKPIRKVDEEVTNRSEVTQNVPSISVDQTNTSKYRKGIEIAFKDKATAIPTAIKMLTSKATEDKKDIFQDVIIEKLLAEKDAPEINSPAVMEQKKKLFEILISRSMNKAQKMDLQLIENLISIDIEAVKEVLKESLIPAQNNSPSQILGQYVQTISNEIKASSTNVLDSKKTSLSQIVGTPNALLENARNNRRSQQGEDEGHEL